MDDFLAKPIQAADLEEMIERVVGERVGADQQRASLLDPRALLAACGGDAVILEKISQAFRASVPEQMTAIRDALRERNAPRLREAAHKLSGMVATFSTLAGNIASELEDYASQEQLEAAAPLVGQIEVMVQMLVRLAGELSLETLRGQAKAINESSKVVSP